MHLRVVSTQFTHRNLKFSCCYAGSRQKGGDYHFRDLVILMYGTVKKPTPILLSLSSLAQDFTVTRSRLAF
jgi:hypothetical protein